MDIHLCSKFEVLQLAPKVGATHLLSLLDPNEAGPAPDRIDAARTLRIACHDLSEPTARYLAPSADHARAIVDFARKLPDDASLVVHCHAGVSRSPAAVILCIAATSPSFDAASSRVRAFFEAQRFIRPNPLLVRHGDEILGLQGRLVRLVQDLQGEQLIRSDAEKTSLILL